MPLITWTSPGATVTEDTDKELMARVVAGDQGAFDTLMRRHERGLVRWVWSMLGDAEEAQDVAQDAFYKAYQSRNRFDPRYGFKTWLYTIARNRAVSFLRTRSRRVSALGTPARGEEAEQDAMEDWADLAVDPARNPREVASAREEAQWLMRAMDRLDEGHREVLRLKYFSGMKSQEIADLLGLEVGTVWSRVHHGLRKLKALAAEMKYE